ATLDNRLLPTLTSSSNSVTNVTVGGHVLLVPAWSIKLHAGVGTDFSPVPADDHVAFDRVDFWVLTAGASGAIGKLTFALGVNYRRGQLRQSHRAQRAHPADPNASGHQDDRPDLRSQLSILNVNASAAAELERRLRRHSWELSTRN